MDPGANNDRKRAGLKVTQSQKESKAPLRLKATQNPKMKWVSDERALSGE